MFDIQLVYSFLGQFSVFSFHVEVLYVISPYGVPFVLPFVVLLSVRYHFVSIVSYSYIPELILVLIQLDSNSCSVVVVRVEVLFIVVVVEALRWSC